MKVHFIKSLKYSLISATIVINIILELAKYILGVIVSIYQYLLHFVCVKT